MTNTDITDRIFLKFWRVSPNLEKTKKQKKTVISGEVLVSDPKIAFLVFLDLV